MLKLHPVTTDKFSNILILSLLYPASSYSPAIFENQLRIFDVQKIPSTNYTFEKQERFTLCVMGPNGNAVSCVSSDWWVSMSVNNVCIIITDRSSAAEKVTVLLYKMVRYYSVSKEHSEELMSYK